ncbi:MAG: zinc transport system ATP-binding protein [Clostridia bacterium]|nr:zinc transport system ATP-binding protein [Clostridia bacterium]
MVEITQMKDEILRLENVWFSYNEVPVLERVNLSVKKNDFIAIIGPNGGGKTTLLKIILGMVSPDRGNVIFLGGSPGENRKYIGYVPQHFQFNFDFPISVWEVVLTGRLGHVGLFKRYTKKDKQIAAEALKEVDMYEFRDRQIGKLSGGQIQRVLIARALVTEPKLLILDEPTANVDKKASKKLYELFKEINKKIPIILVSHDIGFVNFYVNKVIYLNRRLYHQNSNELTYHYPEQKVVKGSTLKGLTLR